MLRFTWEVTLGAVINGGLIVLVAVWFMHRLIPILRELLDAFQAILQTSRRLEELQASRYSDLHGALMRLRQRIEEAAPAIPIAPDPLMPLENPLKEGSDAP